MQWPQNHLSQLSFRLLLESEDLVSEREGRVNKVEALMCCWLGLPKPAAPGRGVLGVAAAAGWADPQGSLQASPALRPQACGASWGFHVLICETSQPRPAHSATHRLLGRGNLIIDRKHLYK